MGNDKKNKFLAAPIPIDDHLYVFFKWGVRTVLKKNDK